MKTKTRSKWLALLLTVTLLMSLFVGIVKAADESAGEVCTVGHRRQICHAEGSIRQCAERRNHSAVRKYHGLYNRRYGDCG